MGPRGPQVLYTQLIFYIFKTSLKYKEFPLYFHKSEIASCRSLSEFVFLKIFGFLNVFSTCFFSIFIFLAIFLFLGIEKSWKSHYFVKNDHFEHTLASKDRFRFIPVRYEPSWIAYPIQPVPVHTGSGYRFQFRFWCFLYVWRYGSDVRTETRIREYGSFALSIYGISMVDLRSKYNRLIIDIPSIYRRRSVM